MLKVILKIITFPARKAKGLVRRLDESIRIRRQWQKNKELVNACKEHECLRVVFLVVHASTWKLDIVFDLMLKDPKFDPVILVIPYTVYGKSQMMHELEQAYSFFEQKGFPVILSHNAESNTWLNVKESLKPDLLFFTNPHPLTEKEYYITNFSDTLSCYVPYAFMADAKYKMQYDQLFHNLTWCNFYETSIHKSLAQKYSRIKGENVVVSGFPGNDIFIDKNHTPKDPWAPRSRFKKRIIWAPHHFMNEGPRSANFLDYSDTMLKIADRYKDVIQFAFKPHPILRPKLYTYPEWGKEKTDAYFQAWDQRENRILEEGPYADLFLTSDALVHDCGSFITEYNFMNKPSLFMISRHNKMDDFNEYGIQALEVLYKSRTYEELIAFIDNVVIGERDTLREQRNAFVENVVIPKKGSTASENIVNYLKSTLG